MPEGVQVKFCLTAWCQLWQQSIPVTLVPQLPYIWPRYKYFKVFKLWKMWCHSYYIEVFVTKKLQEWILWRLLYHFLVLRRSLVKFSKVENDTCHSLTLFVWCLPRKLLTGPNMVILSIYGYSIHICRCRISDSGDAGSADGAQNLPKGGAKTGKGTWRSPQETRKGKKRHQGSLHPFYSVPQSYDVR